MRSHRAPEPRSPWWMTRGGGQQAHDVVAVELAVGEREQAEQ